MVVRLLWRGLGNIIMDSYQGGVTVRHCRMRGAQIIQGWHPKWYNSEERRPGSISGFVLDGKSRIGYCSSTGYARRFRCEDNNADFMCVQPYYYRHVTN